MLDVDNKTRINHVFISFLFPFPKGNSCRQTPMKTATHSLSLYVLLYKESIIITITMSLRKKELNRWRLRYCCGFEMYIYRRRNLSRKESKTKLIKRKSLQKFCFHFEIQNFSWQYILTYRKKKQDKHLNYLFQII